MSSNRLAAISASVIVLLTISVGLYILGAPSQERFRRLDEQRIADLQLLSRVINANYVISNSLPANLDSMQDGTRMSRIPKDPETGSMYDFEPMAIDAYRLCAEFSTESNEARFDDFWEHPTGRQCFSFNAQSTY